MKSQNKFTIIKTVLILSLCLGIVLKIEQQTSTVKAATASRDYPVKPVPFTSVHFNDQFWAPRIEINRTVTIPFAFQKDEETGRFRNFIRAAKAIRGEPFDNHKPPGYPFDDTDVYKVIEGASYSLS